MPEGGWRVYTVVSPSFFFFFKARNTPELSRLLKSVHQSHSFRSTARIIRLALYRLQGMDLTRIYYILTWLKFSYAKRRNTGFESKRKKKWNTDCYNLDITT